MPRQSGNAGIRCCGPDLIGGLAPALTDRMHLACLAGFVFRTPQRTFHRPRRALRQSTVRFLQRRRSTSTLPPPRRDVNPCLDGESAMAHKGGHDLQATAITDLQAPVRGFLCLRPLRSAEDRRTTNAEDRGSNPRGGAISARSLADRHRTSNSDNAGSIPAGRASRPLAQ